MFSALIWGHARRSILMHGFSASVVFFFLLFFVDCWFDSLIFTRSQYWTHISWKFEKGQTHFSQYLAWMSDANPKRKHLYRCVYNMYLPRNGKQWNAYQKPLLRCLSPCLVVQCSMYLVSLSVFSIRFTALQCFHFSWSWFWVHDVYAFSCIVCADTMYTPSKRNRLFR